MKKGWKKFFKISIFLILFLTIFFYLQEVLRDKWIEGEYNTTSKVKGFYAEDSELDVVFVGSSQVYANIAPAVLFENYGITSYDFCANEQPLWISYYYIKEVLKKQNPKLIVLDVFSIYYDDLTEEGVSHINLDDLPMSFNKIEAINHSVPKNLRVSYYFPIIKYHSTWKEFTKLKMDASFYKEKDINKGYSPFVFPMDYKETAKNEIVEEKQFQDIPEISKNWLHKIVTLCKEENVPLLLIKTPNGNVERQKIYNSVAVEAENMNVPFFNMNSILDGQAHTNVMQARVITETLGEYLDKNYDLPDRRNDSNLDESWNESVVNFKTFETRCSLISAKDGFEYLDAIDLENSVIFMSIQDPGIAFDSQLIKKFNDTFNLHIADSFNNKRGAYVAVIDSSNIVYETLEHKDTDEYIQSVSGLNVQLNSYATGSDQDASIKINGTEFSLKNSGYNIAIYDKNLGEMYEMICIDGSDSTKIVRN